MRIDRAQVLAHRVSVQGLHAATPGDRPADLDVLAVGLQDTPTGSAWLGVGVRTASNPTWDDDQLALALTVRGAPHLHRRADLARLRTQLRPREPEELARWLGGHGTAFLESGLDVLAVADQTAELLVTRFPGDTATKGELSGMVSPLLPEPARPWCEGCGVHHVIEGLFRLGTLLAGLELVPGERRLTFRRSPHPTPSGQDEPGDEPPGTGLLRAFVRLAGPVTDLDVAEWLDTRKVALLRQVRADPGWRTLATELTTVQVDELQLAMLAEDIEKLRAAEPPPTLRLLPPRDAYLSGNRDLLVPDRALRKRLWSPQVSPGAVLASGEVAGTWRQRGTGRRLALSVELARPLSRAERGELDAEAKAVADLRGAADVSVELTGP